MSFTTAATATTAVTSMMSNVSVGLTTIRHYEDRSPDHREHTSPFVIVLQIIATVAGLLFNLIEIMLIAFVPALRTFRVTMFVLSLGVADLLIAVSMVMSLCMEFEEMKFENFNICLAWSVVVVLGASAASYSTCGIALDRFVSLQSPIGYNDFMTQKRAYGLITIIWLISIALAALLSFLYMYNPIQFQTESPATTDRQNSYRKTDHPGAKLCDIIWTSTYATISVSVVIFIPTIIIVIIYIKLVGWARLQWYYNRGKHRRMQRIRYWEANTGQIEERPPKRRKCKGDGKARVHFGGVRSENEDKRISVISTYRGSRARSDWFFTSSDEVVYTRKNGTPLPSRKQEDASIELSYKSVANSPEGSVASNHATIQTNRTMSSNEEPIQEPETDGILRHETPEGTFPGDKFEMTKGPRDLLPIIKGTFCNWRSRKAKAAFIMSSIIFWFTALWLPFNSVLLLECFLITSVSHATKQATLWLAYMNCLVNPILFFAANVTYRRILYERITRHKHEKNTPKRRHSTKRRSSTQFGLPRLA